MDRHINEDTDRTTDWQSGEQAKSEPNKYVKDSLEVQESKYHCKHFSCYQMVQTTIGSTIRTLISYEENVKKVVTGISVILS